MSVSRSFPRHTTAVTHVVTGAVIDSWPTPIFKVTRDGVHLTFWCPWCRSNHWHGAHSTLCGPECSCARHQGGGPCTCPRGSGNGHRVAHCWTNSPLRLTGYILREVTQ